ncbi:hypothetical protein FA15DRAFT_600415 [Coprinopsis marcescibilis]|uniref:Uncharacterized protein n=1 Tax=Coprinopsis marcescibilis TaxID=230819 RepID=A0A5C3KVU2_COPMA|nr:hypothetical protein FA15DRAFT_600415 [Coprinopsis marcescibilis]
MRECGTPHVPSFSALRKLQDQLKANMEMDPVPHTSSLGNRFYMNHPAQLLALDWANPLVRKQINVYPEVSKVVSETWQAEKWLKEVDLDQLSPMWADWKKSPHRHFYVKEISQLNDGRFVIPLMWVAVDGYEYAESCVLDVDEVTGRITVIGDPGSRTGLERIRVDQLKYTFTELQRAGMVFLFEDTVTANSIREGINDTPHPTRVRANGRPAFVLRIFPWCDDVSGNRSKQYNAHVNMYLKNANLPHIHHNQEYFVRFSCTSPHASALEQFEALVNDFGVWNKAYDCELEQEIIFQIYGHGLPADNPQQAESCSCSGLGSNHNCRYDTAGGNKAHKESNDGYHDMFSPGTPRTAESTLYEVEQQLRTACLGIASDVTDLQTKTGVKDKLSQHWIEKLIPLGREAKRTRITNASTRDARLKVPNMSSEESDTMKAVIRKEIQEDLMAWLYQQPAERYNSLPEHSRETQLRPGDHFNPLLSVPGIDPHKDSPCEILHTFLLGQDKYIWYETSKGWKKKEEDLFAIRLQSSSIDGLSLDSLRSQYYVKYKNSLIGKHFKAIQQLAIFCLDSSLCSQELFSLWKATGELGALMWFTEITEMKEYLADLEIAIANTLDLWAVCDPNRILTKFKLHALTHLPDDVKRFGPAILFSTEVFECWNAIFRLCSILSNHLSPSHDIADTLSGMERFKHQVSGGWWRNDDGNWTQAGRSVRTFLKSNPELQRRLGWNEGSPFTEGTVRLKSRRQRCPESLSAILGPWSLPNNFEEPETTTWVACKFVVSRTGDMCKESSWIFYHEPDTGLVQAGRICRIAAPSSSQVISQNKEALVFIETYSIASERDTRLGMPVLTQNNTIKALKSVLFIFNAQHSCSTRCHIRQVPVVQERQVTSKLHGEYVHVGDERFFINLHALHNASLIREALPQSLTRPTLIFPDRRKKHDEMAAQLQISGPARRAETQAKRSETIAKKKATARLQTQAAAQARFNPQSVATLPPNGEEGEEGLRGDLEGGMDVDTID